MKIADIDTIAVLGAGTMGHGIAEVAAIAGFDVTFRDIEEAFVQDGIEQIEWSLDKLVEHERLDREEADAARDRITPTVDLEAAVRDADYVIEAVPERLDVKRDVYEAVSEYALTETIFASNTSSLPITSLAEATDRPEKFCGMHFFNPPVRMELVEVIAGDHTAEETLEATEELARAFGKTPVRVRKDTPGFIVNRIAIPLMNEAAWLVHGDEATIESVDSTAKFDIGLPMGAFELADLVGLDVSLDVLEFIHEELGDAYEPCPLLGEKVAAEELGQKTNVGFYDYDNGGAEIPANEGSEEVEETLLAVMANETAKLVAAEVSPVTEIDRAVELGLGFPDGPAALADTYGVDALVSRLEQRQAEVDHPRYGVAESLVDVAERGGFHGTHKEKETAAFDDLRIERPHEHVATIVLDRPHRLNAITPTMLDELPTAIERLEQDADTRVILLRGEGDRAFSVGADISGMSSVWGDSRDAVALSRQGQAAFGRLEETDFLVIAAIDGYCLGGGMELATAADLRIASSRSTFGQTELNLGLIPGWGGTQRLSRLIGEGRAKEVIFTADHYDAEDLRDYGFVNRLVEGDDLVAEAEAWAAELATGPPIAQGYVKQVMHGGRGDNDAGLELEAFAFGQLTQTDDLMEGVTAFLEDREPEFEGV